MQAYVGRFAPSPSGPLHFGSLVCALVSFLHARQARGKWLVRIEDVDTTRVKIGIDKVILSQLLAHGMHWDDDIIYQTDRQHAYQRALDTLHKQQLVYACACTRQAIKSKGKYYTGTCRHLHLPWENNAIRVFNTCQNNTFNDMHLGEVSVDPLFCSEDLSIQRKDGLFAYNLAVVVDDIAQNVSHIVRGADLIETTVQQRHLYNLLSKKPPHYFHLPVISTQPGQKLSKQNHAVAIDNKQAPSNLINAFAAIGLSCHSVTERMSAQELIHWAVSHWEPTLLAKRREILISDINTV